MWASLMLTPGGFILKHTFKAFDVESSKYSYSASEILLEICLCSCGLDTFICCDEDGDRAWGGVGLCEAWHRVVIRG